MARVKKISGIVHEDLNTYDCWRKQIIVSQVKWHKAVRKPEEV